MDNVQTMHHWSVQESYLEAGSVDHGRRILISSKVRTRGFVMFISLMLLS